MPIFKTTPIEPAVTRPASPRIANAGEAGPVGWVRGRSSRRGIGRDQVERLRDRQVAADERQVPDEQEPRADEGDEPGGEPRLSVSQRGRRWA